jgi:hypothetical protein
MLQKGLLLQGQQVSPLGGFADALAQQAGLSSQQSARGRLSEELYFRPEIQGAELRRKTEETRRAGKTAAANALSGFERQAKLVTNTIDKALNTISPSSAGYGSLLSFLPESDARKLKNYLDTIKANIGFDKLQQMRDNSPTGGALGQVSEMENRLLQATSGALDPAQSEQLRENLEIIKELYPQVLAERKEAFDKDYRSLNGNTSPQNKVAPSNPVVPSTDTRILSYEEFIQ